MEYIAKIFSLPSLSSPPSLQPSAPSPSLRCEPDVISRPFLALPCITLPCFALTYFPLPLPYLALPWLALPCLTLLCLPWLASPCLLELQGTSRNRLPEDASSGTEDAWRKSWRNLIRHPRLSSPKPPSFYTGPSTKLLHGAPINRIMHF